MERNKQFIFIIIFLVLGLLVINQQTNFLKSFVQTGSKSININIDKQVVKENEPIITTVDLVSAHFNNNLANKFSIIYYTVDGVFNSGKVLEQTSTNTNLRSVSEKKSFLLDKGKHTIKISVVDEDFTDGRGDNTLKCDISDFPDMGLCEGNNNFNTHGYVPSDAVNNIITSGGCEYIQKSSCFSCVKFNNKPNPWLFLPTANVCVGNEDLSYLFDDIDDKTIVKSETFDVYVGLDTPQNNNMYLLGFILVIGVIIWYLRK